ncbi:MAG: hypothetical protein KDC35_20845 [Acidobacteria bacterium]|nr:hypothetical protein [Acidobacteriota bacterium]
MIKRSVRFITAILALWTTFLLCYSVIFVPAIGVQLRDVGRRLPALTQLVQQGWIFWIIVYAFFITLWVWTIRPRRVFLWILVPWGLIALMLLAMMSVGIGLPLFHAAEWLEPV